MLALISVIISATLAYSYLGAQSTSIGIARNINHQCRARYISETGLALALAYLQSASDWRTEQPHGTWVADEPFGGGTFTITCTDGEDTDGDGVIDGDGDLTDDPADLATITVTGINDGIAHVACAVITPIPGGGHKVLMVVDHPDKLSGVDAHRKELIESWGWEVTLFDEDSSRAELDTAVGQVDIVYLPRGVSIKAGAGELDWSIGVVNEEGKMCPRLEISSKEGKFRDAVIDIVDNTHSITDVFNTGHLKIASKDRDIEYPKGTLAGDAVTLAKRVKKSDPVLVVIESSGSGSGGDGLDADYFALPFAPKKLKDIDFDAEPTVTGSVSNINIPSSNNPGWPGGPKDNFAVQFTGTITISEKGLWRFYTNSDDGSDLYIKGKRVVNNDGLHGMKTRSGFVFLDKGDHDIKVRCFERSGGYGLIVYWRGPGVPSQTVVPASAFGGGSGSAGPRVHVPTGGFDVSELTADGKILFKRAMEWAAGPAGQGLTASYYNVGCCPKVLSDIDWSAKATMTEIVADINIPSSKDPGWAGGPKDDFGVKFSGDINVPEEGTWTFYTNSDDGSDLSIDGTQVVNNDGLHGMKTRSGTIDLTAGEHEIEARVFERGGDYGMIVYWKGPGVPSKTVIPATAFVSGDGGGGYTYQVDWRR